MTWVVTFKMTLSGGVGGLLVDLKEWYYWRKRNDGTKFDYWLAASRFGIGVLGGLVVDLGLATGTALLNL